MNQNAEAYLFSQVLGIHAFGFWMHGRNVTKR